MIIEILTGILVIVSAIYAYLTFRMAKASEASVEAVKQQSEAMLRPYISVSPFIRPHALFLYLRVANTGRTGAQNLRLTIDRDFFQWGEAGKPDKNLRNQNAFSLPIDSLPPGAELLFALGQGWVLFGEKANSAATPVQFSITATYEFFGKKVEEINRIDLRPYVGTHGEHDPVVEELERIRKVLEQKLDA
jgi:hypothetical protein